MNIPSTRNFRSFHDWIRDEAPFTPEETAFVNHSDDFVALSSNSREGGWLDGLVEDTLTWCLPNRLLKVRHSIQIPFSFYGR